MFRKWLATFGGTGLLPGMPGTYASLAAVIIYYGLLRWLGESARIAAAVLAILVSLLGHTLYAWTQQYFKKQDPRQFVLDEVAGQWLTLLVAPSSPHVLATLAMGFFLFRAFDVAKPFPINRIERIRGYAGVLLDDLAAGLCSAAILWVLIRLVGPIL